jgi:hypothetical protein
MAVFSGPLFRGPPLRRACALRLAETLPNRYLDPSISTWPTFQIQGTIFLLSPSFWCRLRSSVLRCVVKMTKTEHRFERSRIPKPYGVFLFVARLLSLLFSIAMLSILIFTSVRFHISYAAAYVAVSTSSPDLFFACREIEPNITTKDCI